MKLYLRYGIVVFLWSTFLLPSAQAQWEKDKVYKITILHTNDHHGHFWQNKQGEYGLSAQKTLIDQIRKEVTEQMGSVLVLSGGDINTGVPESDMFNAEPDFLGMSAIGYDAMAVGNHEFDNPLAVLRQQEKWSAFPFLSANIYDKNTGKRLFKPYALFDRQGLKIAVMGLTTEDTVRTGSKKILAGIEFRDPKKEAKKLVEQLRATDKPDIIIAATHMGHYNNGLSGSNAPGDVELARYLPTGAVNMIVGGHSQNPVCMEAVNERQKAYVPGTPCIPDTQNGIWIVQAHEWGKYVGRADFKYLNGKMILDRYALIPVNLKKYFTSADGKKTYINYDVEIVQNPEVLSMLTPFKQKGEASLGVEIGRTDTFLDGERNIVRYQQTNMGKLIIQAQIARTQSSFGLISSGSIRASIPVGPISYGDILTVQPFGNSVGYAEMSGKELVNYLSSVANMKPGSGAYPQFHNIHFKINEGVLSHVVINNQPIDMKKSYRFSLPSYNASGGDGYPDISGTFVNTGFIDAEVLKDYIKTHPTLTDAGYP